MCYTMPGRLVFHSKLLTLFLKINIKVENSLVVSARISASTAGSFGFDPGQELNHDDHVAQPHSPKKRKLTSEEEKF